MAQVSVLGPNDVYEAWQLALPDAVVETFNKELLRRFDGKNAKVLKDTLLDQLQNKGLSKKTVTEQNWLGQVWKLYEEQGWHVEYRKPKWDDNFAPYFWFVLP